MDSVLDDRLNAIIEALLVCASRRLAGRNETLAAIAMALTVPERVYANFNAWLASQTAAKQPVGADLIRDKPFTEEQLQWLEMIRDHIAANLGIEPDDFEYAPFSQHGGLGKVHQLFGDRLNAIIEELNETLAA